MASSRALLLLAPVLAGAGLLTSCAPKVAAPLAAAPAAPAPPPLAYPQAARGEVVDDYFGTSVPDPYRWLEDTDAPETRRWIDAENQLTASWLSQVPQRQAIVDRLHALWNYERIGVPFHQGDRYFWSRNDGLQNQAVLYSAPALDQAPVALIDPNTWSPDGTVALTSYAIDEQAHYIAYGRSDGGSDWSTWRVRDIRTGQDLPDELKWIKFTSVSWLRDGTGFFYDRYPEPAQALADVNENNRLYLHRLGSPQDQDLLVVSDDAHPRRGFGGSVTDDGKYLVITGSEGTDQKSRVYVKPLSKGWQKKGANADVVKLLDQFDAAYYLVTSQGSRFWFWTNKDAPRGRVIAVDLDKPDAAHWTEVVPEQADVLESANRVGDDLVLSYLHDAHNTVQVDTLLGVKVRDVPLPGLGSTGGFAGDPDRSETFYSFTGFTDPASIYRYDVDSGEATLFKRPAVQFNPDDYVTQQDFATSKDGTRVPIFITHKKGIVLDGSNPTILYGYGGFNISLTPWFSVSNQVWMELGGVYAVANLRGGGEYGEAWHQAGALDHKQNVFDDFIAAAQYLEAQGYTRPDKLAIQGGSNGGLLIGAVETQRPDLFGAALPAVGVMDMLRYHKFTIGWAWASDYGTSDDPAQFQTLYAYSPYQNIKDGVSYPPTFVTTGDHDDRVVPGHSFKFTAAMQHAQAGAAPILIRVETRAGHGGGKPTSMVIDEIADRYAFLVKVLGMQPALPITGAPVASESVPVAPESVPAGE